MSIEKKIQINNSFYSANKSSAPEARCGLIFNPCIIAYFPICTIADGCYGVNVPCSSNTPCSDKPCSDKPCSHSPCGDTPSSASLSLTGGIGQFDWTLTLTKEFTTGNKYASAGITTKSFTNGGTNVSSSDIVSSETATDSGTTTVGPVTVTYNPGTYKFWGFAKSATGEYWQAGSGSVEVLASQEEFNWTFAGSDPITGTPISGTSKRSGLGAYITAEEWNRLVRIVNDKTGSSIPRVNRGEVANSAATVNRVASVLGVSSATPGKTPFSADFLNRLMTAVNNL